MNKFRTRKLMAALSLVTASGLVSSGFAQSATPAAATDSALTLEKFEVTGSYLPQSATAPTVPVSVMTAQDIANTGVQSNLLEVLKKTMPQLIGNTNLGSNNANVGGGSTNGGAQIALRNLPTLVLINGRRAPFSPVSARGGYEFVDVNLIPIAAIERVEVLTDGASALYGSDAVSGVVNIILKSDYQGVEVGATYGFSDNKGKYAERGAHVVAGASNGKTSVTISGEWYRSDPLYQYERSYSNPIYGTPTYAGVINIGGAYYRLNPSLNAPPAGHTPIATLVANGVYAGPYTSTSIQPFFNLANAVTLLGANDRKATTVAITQKVSENITLFGDFLYSNTNASNQLNAQPVSTVLAADAASNPTDVSITARNRFTDFPRQYFYNTNSVRGVAGLKGQINQDWSWETAANFGEVHQTYVNPGLIDTIARTAAVAAGTVNFTAYKQTSNAYQSLFGTALVDYLSKLQTYDALIRGKLFELPAGNINIAVGGQLQREALSATSDRNSNSATFNWDSGVSISPFAQGRSVKSVYAEVGIPLISPAQKVPFVTALDFDGAVRYDNYKAISKKPTTPKYSLRWQPVGDQLTIRGTYSESFAAPLLYELYGPVSTGSTASITVPGYSTSGAATGVTVSGQANSRTGSNPNLAPSTSDNVSAGFVYSPKQIRGLTFTADYFHINQYAITGTVGSSTILRDVERFGAASRYAGQVRIGKGGVSPTYFDGGTPITSPGLVSLSGLDQLYVSDQTINLGGRKIDGVDVGIKYTFNMNSVGKFDIGTTATIYNHIRIRSLPTDPYEEYSNLVSGNFNTLPDYRTYTTLTYTRGSLSANIGHTFIPSLYDISGVEGVNTRVGTYNSFDTQVSYRFGSEIKYLSGLQATVGVTDVFNHFGPTSPSNTDAHIDTGLYGAVGRFMYMSLAYKF